MRSGSRTRVSIAVAIAGIGLFAPQVGLAQSFNIDLRVYYGGPSDSLGAGAGQTGHWNSFDNFTAFDPPQQLNDLAGNPSLVEASFPLSFHVNSGRITNPVIPPDASALLDDFIPVTDIPERLRLRGLRDGFYDVYAYCTSLEVPTSFIVMSGSERLSSRVEGGWNGGFEDGVNFHKFSLSVVGSRLDVDWVTASPGGVGVLSGLQLVAVPSASSVSLLAIGVVAACWRRGRPGS